MSRQLKPGMTPDELRQWRLENWTIEQFATELQREEERRSNLIERHNNLKSQMLNTAKAIVRMIE